VLRASLYDTVPRVTCYVAIRKGGMHRLTYVDALRTTNSAYAQFMLLSDRCTRYSILTGIFIDMRYAPHN
jgi:hypothetical protein